MNSKMQVVILTLFMAFALRLRAQTAAGGDSKTQPTAPPASTDGKQGPLEARVEKYLRNLYAWGPAYEIKMGALKPSPIPDLLELPVTVSMAGQGDTAIVYVTKDGNFLIRGDLTNMSVDPFADVRSKLHVGNSPSMGPADAKVTLIEFADFECPSCRQLDRILRDFLPTHPEVRLVFKNFPLTQIHPWAMTAAIAGQCTYQQNPSAFWKIHDAIFDAQDVISPSNVWDKMQDLASKQGLNMETFQSCMSNPETAHQIEQSIQEGRALNITGTPTTFVNNRRMVGPDESQLDQYIQFEKN